MMKRFTRFLMILSVAAGLGLSSCTTSKSLGSSDDVYYSGSEQTNLPVAKESVTETTEYVIVNNGDTDKYKPTNVSNRRRHNRNDVFLSDLGNFALDVLCFYMWWSY